MVAFCASGIIPGFDEDGKEWECWQARLQQRLILVSCENISHNGKLHLVSLLRQCLMVGYWPYHLGYFMRYLWTTANLFVRDVDNLRRFHRLCCRKGLWGTSFHPHAARLLRFWSIRRGGWFYCRLFLPPWTKFLQWRMDRSCTVGVIRVANDHGSSDTSKWLEMESLVDGNRVWWYTTFNVFVFAGDIVSHMSPWSSHPTEDKAVCSHIGRRRSRSKFSHTEEAQTPICTTKLWSNISSAYVIARILSAIVRAKISISWARCFVLVPWGLNARYRYLEHRTTCVRRCLWLGSQSSRPIEYGILDRLYPRGDLCRKSVSYGRFYF